MSLDTFTLTYDKGTDVLVLQIGPAREAFVIQEANDGIILQLDTETRAIVGMVVTGLSQRTNAVMPQLGTLVDDGRTPNRDA